MARMVKRLPRLAAAALVVLPIATATLAFTGVIRADGGHGLELWLLLCACGVLVFCGTVLSLVFAFRAQDAASPFHVLAWVGGVALLLFGIYYGTLDG